jgi:hypothetical protein
MKREPEKRNFQSTIRDIAAGRVHNAARSVYRELQHLGLQFRSRPQARSAHIGISWLVAETNGRLRTSGAIARVRHAASLLESGLHELER